MSGAGRKHRAKHLTRQYLDSNSWLGPEEDETIAVCLESPHGHHLRVLILSLAASLLAEGGAATPVAQTVPGSGSISTSAQHPLGDPRLTEALATLPGKFHKVIWLGIRDVVIVENTQIKLKLSPDQLNNFLKAPANAEWKELVEKAQLFALDTRHASERAPQYAMSGATTTSALPAEGAGEAHDHKDGDEVSETDSLDMIVNRNRGNIKHRQQYFFGVDNDSEDEEDEEEDDDEDHEE